MDCLWIRVRKKKFWRGNRADSRRSRMCDALRADFRLIDLRARLQCATCRPRQSTSAAPQRTPNGQASALQRRSHRWPHVPHRSLTCQSGPLAGARGPQLGRPDGDDAVLRTHRLTKRPARSASGYAGAQDITRGINRRLICWNVLPRLTAGVPRSVAAGSVPGGGPAGGLQRRRMAAPRVRLVATGGTIANARDGRWTRGCAGRGGSGLAAIAQGRDRDVRPDRASRCRWTTGCGSSIRLNQVAAEPHSRRHRRHQSAPTRSRSWRGSSI